MIPKFPIERKRCNLFFVSSIFLVRVVEKSCPYRIDFWFRWECLIFLLLFSTNTNTTCRKRPLQPYSFHAKVNLLVHSWREIIDSTFLLSPGGGCIFSKNPSTPVVRVWYKQGHERIGVGNPNLGRVSIRKWAFCLTNICLKKLGMEFFFRFRK